MQRRKGRRHGYGKPGHLIGNSPFLGIRIGCAAQRDTPLCEIIGKAERNRCASAKHTRTKAAERHVIPGHHQAGEKHDRPKQGDFWQFGGKHSARGAPAAGQHQPKPKHANCGKRQANFRRHHPAPRDGAKRQQGQRQGSAEDRKING